MAGNNRKNGVQLDLGLSGFKKKSFPPAEVRRRALGMKAAKAKRIAEAEKAKNLDSMYRVLHRTGMDSKATVGDITARIRTLQNEIIYHENQISTNNTSGDISEAREHTVIKKEKEDILDGLKKLINQRKKR